MIRKHKEEDLEEIINIWYQASTLAHPFLDSKFVEKVEKDMRNIYIPNSETWVYEENNSVIGFIGIDRCLQKTHRRLNHTLAKHPRFNCVYGTDSRALTAQGTFLLVPQNLPREIFNA